jgi:voltage-gated potassium channel
LHASRYNFAAGDGDIPLVTATSKGDNWIRLQGPVFATVLLVSIIVVGTVGYEVIEGWSAWDAFYMTVITVTTVGYREVHDLSQAGQMFTVFIIVSGVGAALYSFTLLAAVVVEGGLPKRFQRRRAARMLETISDHFIICGYGRIGSLIASQFRRQKVPYVVVERNAARQQLAIEEGGLALEADASREDVLKRVGIARARGLIAAVGTDAENVYTVLSARVLRPDLLIIGRAEGEDAAVKLKHAGANRVISPYHIGAVQMAQTALRPAVVDFIALATSSDSVELALEEITVAATSALADRSLLEANLRQRFSIIVIGIQRQDGRMEFNPEPETSIRSGDKLVVLGRPDSLKRLETEAGS